jgi:hypothetical protein
MRGVLVALACSAGLIAACGSGEPRLSEPRTATTPPVVAAHSPRASVPLADGSQPAADDEAPIDVGALLLPQPDDTEPESVR